MIVQELGQGPGRIPRAETRRGRGLCPSLVLPAMREVCDYGTVMVVPSPVAVMENVPAVVDA